MSLSYLYTYFPGQDFGTATATTTGMLSKATREERPTSFIASRRRRRRLSAKRDLSRDNRCRQMLVSIDRDTLKSMGSSGSNEVDERRNKVEARV